MEKTKTRNKREDKDRKTGEACKTNIWVTCFMVGTDTLNAVFFKYLLCNVITGCTYSSQGLYFVKVMDVNMNKHPKESCKDLLGSWKKCFWKWNI